MKLFKRILCLVLCLCTVLSMVTIGASAATTKVSKITLKMDEPALGQKPATTAKYSSSSSFDLVSIQWNGDMDSNGCFKANTVYSATIVLKIKDEYKDRIFSTIEESNVVINNKKCSNGQVSSYVSDDKRTLTLAYALPYVFTESGSKKNLNYINIVNVMLDVPEAGNTPATAAQVLASSAQVYVKDVKWTGTLDSKGRFIGGNQYQAEFVLGIKPGEFYSFASQPWMYKSKMTVNSQSSHDAQVHYDRQTASVFYTFTVVPTAETITETNNVKLTITPPAVGQLPQYNAKVAAGWKSYVSYSQWSGNFDEYGRFKAGERYTFTVTTKVDPTVGDFVYSSTGYHLINNEFALCKGVSDGGKTLTISYTFPALTGTAPAVTKTSVSGFQPGDYGTMHVSGSAVAWLYEDATKDSELGAIKSGKDLLVVSAFVKDNWCAVLDNGKLLFVEHSDGGTFLDYVKYGSGSVEPYRDPWQTAANLTGGQPITLVHGFEVNAQLNKEPVVTDITKLDDHQYYLSDFSWNCDGPLQPYIWAEVVLTCKAKEGYYFTHDVKLKDYFLDREPQKITYVDKDTVKLTYYKWIDGSTIDIDVTEEMKQYNELNELKSPYPTFGTAELYLPLDGLITAYDHASWYMKYWKYPTAKKMSNMVDLLEKHFKIQILDYDLSDDFTGLVGEWCRVVINGTAGFIPKALLTNVQLKDFWEGAPAKLHNSPFKFAGGSGTEKDPYLIATAEQLDAVRKDLDAHYKLIADIDLSGWGNWVPIGGTPAFGAGLNSANMAQFGGGAFTGGFDGNGHVISGMTIEVNRETPYMQGESNSHFYGLFAMAGEATIKNLGLVNYNIDLNYTAVKKAFWIWIGAFSGWVTGGSMTDCYAAGGNISVNIQTAAGSDPTINMEIGGLTGEVALTTVKRCYNTSDVTVKCNNPSFMAGGGICGTLCNAWLVECFNTGDITLPLGDVYSSWTESFVGGITAEVVRNGIENTMGKPKEQACYIWNCYNTGHLTANTVAGIYVYNNNSAGYVENCYNIGELTCNPVNDGVPRKAQFLSSWATCMNSTYVKNCYSNGNGVSGDAWQKSAKLGRMVLKCNPEDSLVIPTVAPKIAYTSNQPIILDGKTMNLQAYALKDAKGNPTNYVKLRDIAYLLNGTSAQFELGWDGNVNILTKTKYTPNGTEMKTPFSGDRTYTIPTAKTNINGKVSNLEAIVLTDDNGGGYTYYKLRDIAEALNFNVAWRNGIVVETNKPYTGT